MQDQRGFSLSGKDLAFQRRFGMLPTAKNRANNSIPRRLDTQFENHHIFTTVAWHKLPEDLGQLRSIITEASIDVCFLCSGISNLLSQLKSMVDSWTTKHNNNHDCTSIFDENIGEDGLSIQQRMMSISTILIILHPLLLIVKHWIHHLCLMLNIRTHTQFLQRELMNCGRNCLPIKPSYPLIKECKPSILILLKFLQQTSLYHSTILNYMSGLLTTNLQDVDTVRIFVIVPFSNLLPKKPCTNHQMMYNKGNCFVVKMMENKFTFGGLCPHTGPAMC